MQRRSQEQDAERGQQELCNPFVDSSRIWIDISGKQMVKS